VLEVVAILIRQVFLELFIFMRKGSVLYEHN